LSAGIYQTAGEHLGSQRCSMHPNPAVPRPSGSAQARIVGPRPCPTGTRHFFFVVYNLGLGERFFASASSFSRGAEAEHTSHTAEVKCLSGSNVNCVELVFRSAGQFMQVEARIPESRNRNPPKRRTIGELLKKVIFTNHRSLRDVRLLGNAYIRHGWVDCQIHRFNPEDRILRRLSCQGPPKCFGRFFAHRPLELSGYSVFDAFSPDSSPGPVARPLGSPYFCSRSAAARAVL
jgi:hypothetical protein